MSERVRMHQPLRAVLVAVLASLGLLAGLWGAPRSHATSCADDLAQLLSEGSQEDLNRLTKSATDSRVFRAKLGEIRERSDAEAVLVVACAMLELEWSRNDLRPSEIAAMPKILAGATLRDMIPRSRGLRGMIKSYFRALRAGKARQAADAKRALSKWLRERYRLLVYDAHGGYFRLIY